MRSVMTSSRGTFRRVRRPGVLFRCKLSGLTLRRGMGRIGPVELLILVFLLAAFVGVIFLVRLGVRCGSQPGRQAPGTPSGRWATDPTRRHELRWWDGQAWSPSVSDNGVLGHDPI